MELPEQILKALDSSQASNIDSLSLADSFGIDHQKIVGAIKSLESLGQVIQSEAYVIQRWQLTKEGELIAKNGSHEAVVYDNVPSGDGILQDDLKKKIGDICKIGLGKAMSAGWIQINKESKMIQRKVDSITDTVKANLTLVAADKINEIQKKSIDEYKKRKLLHEVNFTAYKLSKGSEFSLTIEKAVTELTPEMISTGSWKTANFKAYNFAALGIAPQAGHLHPLLKVRAEYRQIFLEMGFCEMPTNNYVESSFWNFDALFQPQQHPARDAHDTFFISDPANASDFPPDYLEKVKKVHSQGGFGSQGYGYDWKIEEAQKNILRTHTTAVSARMLYKLAQEKEFKPQKYFSIDRVFRNETLDATHLAEFHQIEGVVADYDLTLGDLIGIINEFFKKLGIEKIRFKPAYNPYTEPSMEIFSYHEGLAKWVEIGNSGIFRPEMLLPMGLPENVHVIAWGLSLERPTMIKYGIDNIRDLVGHKVNLKMVQENPMCRLDKDNRDPVATLASVTENRWIKIEEQLNFLQKQLNNIQGGVSNQTFKSSPNKTSENFLDIVIEMDPEHKSQAVKYLALKLSQVNTVYFSSHIHSTQVKGSPPPLDFWPESSDSNKKRLQHKLGLTLIWKPVGPDAVLKMGNPTKSQVIKGEVNVCRYLCRLMNSNFYENSSNPAVVHWIDYQLDALHQLLHRNFEGDIMPQLAKEMSLCKRPQALTGIVTLADICYASISFRIRRVKSQACLASTFVPVPDLMSK